MKTIRILLFAGFIGLIASCNNPTEQKVVYVNSDSISGTLIADTIIYDVVINNLNPDDYWTEECLQYLKKDTLFNSIFDRIYKGELTPYDFFTNEPLSIDDVREIEADESFSRDAIGKIQFKEVWYFDADFKVMNKKVISMTFGVEQFNNLGELKGYLPLFKILTY